MATSNTVDEDSTTEDVWDQHLYKNWVRGAKGLEFLQDGLKICVGEKAPICRDQHLQNITQVPSVSFPQCNRCTSENLLPEHAKTTKACKGDSCIQKFASTCFGHKPIGRRKCPIGICSKLYDAIVLDHRHRDPLWKNTDPSTWCSDPLGWSFARCFQTTPGPGTSAQDTDASGLLGFIINSLSMENWLACNNMDSATACIFYKARCIRNEILHKAKLELDDETLDEYLDAFIAVLQDPKCLLVNAAAQDAVNNLTKLKSRQINISQQNETQILIRREEALSELEEKKQEALQEINNMADKRLSDLNKTSLEAMQNIKDTTSSGISDVTKTKTEALRVLKDATSSVMLDVKKTKAEALQDLKDAKISGILDVNETKKEALRDLKDATSCVMSDMNKAKTETLQNLKDAKACDSLDVNRTKTEAIEDLKDTTSSVMSDINKTKTEAFQSLKDATSRGVLDVDKTKAEALLDLNDATSRGIFDMNKTKTEALRDLRHDAGSGILVVNTAKKDAIQEIEEAKSDILEDLKKQSYRIVTNDGTKSLSSVDSQSSSSLSGQHSIAVPLPVTQPDDEYLQLKQRLKDDLIELYRRQHSTMCLSPLIEKQAPLLDIYVMPDFFAIKEKTARDSKNDTEQLPVSFRNVFFKENKTCSEIYLTADPGLGKTAFSKRLALTWCHIQKSPTNQKYFSQEEIETINGFCFVFLLLLRDNSSECHIDDLILAQITSQLAHDYTRENLVNILCKERCLVILDGLDEWSHPSNSCKQKLRNIPHRKARERTTVLTTTRPWKLSVSGLNSSQIDQKLEITGLNKESANALKRSVISHLFDDKDNAKLQHNVTDFNRAVKEKQIADLEAIPLLLMYLLFLWYYKIELGQSHCDLYSQIIELLLSRTVQNYIEFSPKVDRPLTDIPQCFCEKIHCRQFFTLLTALGQLAYQTLFKETREQNKLAIDGSAAEQYLTKEALNFCLKTGLISQNKVSGTLLEQKSKVSFAHKTVQEFFAAIYMHSTFGQTSVPVIVLPKCKCIKDILEMSTLLKFSCGMNVNVSRLISGEMVKIINEDEITHEYRSSLERYTSTYGLSHPLKDFQDMCISCCKEVPRENEISICLQDIFIERSCRKEQYRENLKQMATRNKQNIRSLYIDMNALRYSPYITVQEVIDYFVPNDMENIEKIHYYGEHNDSDILPLLKPSVKCIYLSCRLSRGSLSRLLVEKVTRLQRLEAIHINWFKMSHSVLTLLYDFVSIKHCIQQIELNELLCTDHVLYSCTGNCMDLSQHSQLRKLTLNKIRVSELNINMASLEKCCLVNLANPDLVLRFINCAPADSTLHTFVCCGLKSPVAIETMLETLCLSVHVKHVELREISFGEREVLSSEMVNIERVVLRYVSMTASVLQGIVDVVQQQQQRVTVSILVCDIKPESEFLAMKQKIKASWTHFRVLQDSKEAFQFKTVK